MNLRQGSRFWRTLPLEGWNASEEQWEETPLRGSLRANDQNITGTEYSLRKRILLCSDKDRIIPHYYMIRIDDEVYMLESEVPSRMLGAPYQYAYQVRRADYRAILFHYVPGAAAASGMPTQNERQPLLSTYCDVSNAGVIGSTEIETADYSRYKVYFPNDAAISNDVEIDFVGSSLQLSADILAIQGFGLLWQALALRRGIGS